MARCPSCSFASADSDQCARCGIVFAKYRRHTALLPPRTIHLNLHVDWRRQGIPLLAMVGLALVALHLGYTPLHFAPWRSRRATAAIDTQREPLQTTFSSTPRSIVLHRHGNTIVLQPRASYDIAGKVVAQDYYYTDSLAVAAPVDLTLIWGPLLSPAATKAITYSHYGRFGAYRFGSHLPVPLSVLSSHISNNHLVPATDAVRAAIMSVGVGDTVELWGDLVDLTIAPEGRAAGADAHTSLVRDDQGAGACEIVYVTRIQIGRKIYE